VFSLVLRSAQKKRKHVIVKYHAAAGKWYAKAVALKWGHLMSDSPEIHRHPAAQSASRPRKGAGISLIVLHSEPRPAAEALAAYAAPDAQAAPHYYIDTAGTITQLVDEQRAARHSGKANWNKRRRDIDQISIGITLEHTPGSPVPPEQLGALQWLIASRTVAADGVVRWEDELPGLSTADGVLTPANLPPPIAEPTTAGPVVLGEEEAPFDEGTICGGVMADGPVVLGEEDMPGMPGPVVLSEDDPAFGARLRSFLQGETYRQRGAGYHADWSFHQYATKNNLGAPLAPSAVQAKQVSFNGKNYGFQPFARDVLFNEIPKWGEVQSLNSALGGAIPPAGSGVARLVLEAGYAASGGALHDNQAFHQRAVREKLGAPLGSGYSAVINGQKIALQVFSCDTLYTPYNMANEAKTNWGDVRRLSDEPPGPMREGLWAETYKISGATYQAGAPFQQLAGSQKLGTPLTGAYSFDFEGHPFTMQVFACDTLYAAQNGEVKRLSGLPVATPSTTPTTPTPPVEQDRVDDPLSDKRHTFNVLPFASWPLLGQPYGYTKFSIKHRGDFYSQTQGRHSGMDFMVPVGTQLLSIGYGLVVGGGDPKNKQQAPFGGCPPMVVLVRYGNVYAVYGHCSQVLVQRGQFVKPGDVLALSGNFNGAHLHFELRPVPAKLLGNRDPGQAAVNSSIAINPVPFFSSEIQNYFAEQYGRLRGTQYDFCCDAFLNQPDTNFGKPVDTRPCTN
jgi:murein DD-endopeptidase MepM/ murein hydrolase activator NlpD